MLKIKITTTTTLCPGVAQWRATRCSLPFQPRRSPEEGREADYGLHVNSGDETLERKDEFKGRMECGNGRKGTEWANFAAFPEGNSQQCLPEKKMKW